MLDAQTAVQESVVAEFRKQSSIRNDSVNTLNPIHKKRGRFAAPVSEKDILQSEGKCERSVAETTYKC